MCGGGLGKDRNAKGSLGSPWGGGAVGTVCRQSWRRREPHLTQVSLSELPWTPNCFSLFGFQSLESPDLSSFSHHNALQVKGEVFVPTKIY